MSTPCLLGMPPEIRNHIFELVLITQKSLSIGHGWTRDPQGNSIRSEVLLQQPALARVNRQAREEALPVFYSQNSFLVDQAAFFKYFDRQNCYYAFANEKAQEYLEKLSYQHDLSRYAINSEPDSIEMTLDESKRLRFEIRGPVSEVCVCDAMAKLRTLSAVFDPTPDLSLEGASRLPGLKLLDLAARVLSVLVDGLRIYRMPRSSGVLGGTFVAKHVCEKCGKVVTSYRYTSYE
ncbi:hypothetical protein LTR15_006478 [Elasticomyces elasticus]|nr:hypothetical protein LTR15_006478 [Elasticomyces elasticus]